MTTLTLPEGSFLRSAEFTFGVATSSFQIEGDRQGRESNIWDTFCRRPGTIKDGSNADIACDHINRWQQDIELIASLNVDAYRFSIAWGRVINADGSINKKGLQFYVKLVEALAKKQIEPHVTLYHWDLPQYLEEAGGWLNRDTAYRFAEYAEIVVRALGDKVSSYSTINEPFCSAYLAYEAGIHAPGPKPGKLRRKHGRQAAHHLLLAHGLALPKMRRAAPSAEHGIVLNFSPCYPASDSVRDKQAADRAHQYHNLWYLQPLLQGSYPEIMEQLDSEERPHIQPCDMETITQPIDFLGVNYYTKTTFRATDNDWFSDVPASGSGLTTMGWEVYPEGLTEILIALNRQFSNLPTLYITENGIAVDDKIVNDEINDERRTDYFQQHLLAVHNAVEAGVDIRGYFAWSLMDNFEWTEGYTPRFGIVHVNYETQQRTLKNSAKALQQLFLTRQSQPRAVENSC